MIEGTFLRKGGPRSAVWERVVQRRPWYKRPRDKPPRARSGKSQPDMRRTAGGNLVGTASLRSEPDHFAVHRDGLGV